MPIPGTPLAVSRPAGGSSLLDQIRASRQVTPSLPMALHPSPTPSFGVGTITPWQLIAQLLIGKLLAQQPRELTTADYLGLLGQQPNTPLPLQAGSLPSIPPYDVMGQREGT
jgi:hypothetical protein